MTHAFLKEKHKAHRSAEPDTKALTLWLVFPLNLNSEQTHASLINTQSNQNCRLTLHSSGMSRKTLDMVIFVLKTRKVNGFSEHICFISVCLDKWRETRGILVNIIREDLFWTALYKITVVNKTDYISVTNVQFIIEMYK